MGSDVRQDERALAPQMSGNLWSKPGVRIALVGIAWLAALVNIVRLWRYVWGSNEAFGDFGVYLAGTRWWLSGHRLCDYVTDNGLGFTYPPFAAVVFTPLALMPDRIAQTIWTILNIAVVCAIGIGLASVLVRRHGPSAVWLTAGLIVAVYTQTIYVQSNALFGQISLVLVLMSLLESGRILSSRRWGALTGIAAAIKLTPGLFGVMHLLVDRRRFVWSFGAGLLTTLVGVALLPRDALDYVTRALWQTDRIGPVDLPGNMTWTGLLVRFHMNPTLNRVLVLTLSVATVILALWNARRHWQDAPLVSATVVGCASVLVVPLSWPHHAAWLLVWATMILFARQRWLQVLGAGLVVLSVFWVPVATAVGDNGKNILYAFQILVMAATAVIPVTLRGTSPTARRAPSAVPPSTQR